jgi:histidinol-phosphate phosphatase family protein
MMLKNSSEPGFRARPKQAVIFAGGRGARLRPLTDTRPKPMIAFHGKPFLAHLIEMLRTQGFEDILLLLGYLPDVIQDYFKDGSGFGVRIQYSVTPPEDLTARRLAQAGPLLDPYFLLLYCDNYWPLQIGKMWQRLEESGAAAMLTVYSNQDGYSKDNVQVDSGGYIVNYDRSRASADLRGVEIGYAILPRSVLRLLPEEDAPFEAAVYPQLIQRNELLAYVTDHRYYSVGSHERLPLTDAFFARRPAILLDRDGVLNKEPPRAEYVRRWEEFEWLPGAREALRLLHSAGYRIIVVSNQAGIGRGRMSEGDLEKIHERMREEARAAGGQIDAIYYCPHDWDHGCECRKPNPGMLFQAQRDFHLDLSRTWFIGDDERDAEAAQRASCRSQLVPEHASLLSVVRGLVSAGAAN